MKRVAFAASLAAVSLVAGAARADEGLWTFDNFPAARVKATYGVDITPAWLARVQAASVRLSVGCSASEVSAHGLVLTNHHCAADCLQAFSTPGHDLTQGGYLAATPADEHTCPGLEAEVLLRITDVTQRMSAAGAGLAGEALVKARTAASSGIAAEACGVDATLKCQIVRFYQGGQYKLYKYRRYADVRLVFSPGDKAAFFGGDPDNFNFPRYDLDCAFLRLYEGGKPVATPGHLRWRDRPPAAGEPVLVAGNPGGTFREDTVAQLEAQRDVSVPVAIAQFSELRGRLIRFIEESPDHARMADEPLNDLENDLKVYRGRLEALNDGEAMAAKRAEEAGLRAKALATMGPGYGDPWADMARAQAAYAAIYAPYRQLERGPMLSSLFDYARKLVRAAEERAKPSADRLPGYADSDLARLEKQMLDPQPIEPALEQLALEFWLSKTREELTADSPYTRLVLGKESPEGLSARLVAGTKLGDPAFRKALWDGGADPVRRADRSGSAADQRPLRRHGRRAGDAGRRGDRPRPVRHPGR